MEGGGGPETKRCQSIQDTLTLYSANLTHGGLNHETWGRDQPIKGL